MFLREVLIISACILLYMHTRMCIHDGIFLKEKHPLVIVFFNVPLKMPYIYLMEQSLN